MSVEEIAAALSAQPLHSVDDLASGSPEAPPRVAGFYSWWQLPGALPGVDATPHPAGDFELLYLGIAPANATSKSSLRKRLAKHHRGAIGSSTFRFCLAAFLWREMGWEPAFTDRPVLSTEDIARLGVWQKENLRVQWVAHDAPWVSEVKVIQLMRPALNRDHNETHPSYSLVGSKRQALRDAARSNVASR